VKILVCVRDLRAIICSMEKLWRKNKHLADPTIKPDSRPLDMATIPHRVQHWLNTPPVGVGVTVVINAIQTASSATSTSSASRT